MGRIISARQRAANQRNAQLSTGPKTEAGKAQSRANALKHGLSAETLLMPGETVEAFEAFRDEIIAQLAPVGLLEEEASQRVATLMWRLRRVPAFEAALYKREERRKIDLFSDELGDEPFDGSARIDGEILRRILSSGLLDKLTRYDVALQRQIRDELKTLRGFQEQRRQRENERRAAEHAEVINLEESVLAQPEPARLAAPENVPSPARPYGQLMGRPLSSD